VPGAGNQTEDGNAVCRHPRAEQAAGRRFSARPQVPDRVPKAPGQAELPRRRLDRQRDAGWVKQSRGECPVAEPLGPNLFIRPERTPLAAEWVLVDRISRGLSRMRRSARGMPRTSAPAISGAAIIAHMAKFVRISSRVGTFRERPSSGAASATRPGEPTVPAYRTSWRPTANSSGSFQCPGGARRASRASTVIALAMPRPVVEAARVPDWS